MPITRTRNLRPRKKIRLVSCSLRNTRARRTGPDVERVRTVTGPPGRARRQRSRPLRPNGLGDAPASAGRPDGTPRAAILASADEKERDVALRLFERGLQGGELVIADKSYAGKDIERATAERFGATVLRPRRKDGPGRGPHLAPIRRCIESIFCSLKDRLGLERHHARSLHGLRARIAARLLAPRRRRLAQSPPRPANQGLRRPRRLTTRGSNHLG